MFAAHFIHSLLPLFSFSFTLTQCYLLTLYILHFFIIHSNSQLQCLFNVIFSLYTFSFSFTLLILHTSTRNSQYREFVIFLVVSEKFGTGKKSRNWYQKNLV